MDAWETGGGAAGRGWWLVGGGGELGVCDRLGSSIISIWLTRTVWIRGGPRCPEVLMQRIELNSLLIYTWTWGDVWVCFYTNRLTDTQTHRQTDRLTQDWSFTSDPVEWAPIWYFSAYLLHWNHLKKFIKWTTAILFPVAEWMSWNQAPPIITHQQEHQLASCSTVPSACFRVSTFLSSQPCFPVYLWSCSTPQKRPSFMKRASLQRWYSWSLSVVHRSWESNILNALMVLQAIMSCHLFLGYWTH